MREFDINRYFNRLREKVATYVAKSSPRISARVVAAFNALQGPSPSLSVIQSISFLGFPEDVLFLRALYWKLLLRYLPTTKSQWSKVLTEKRTVYFSAVERFIMEPNHVRRLRDAITPGSLVPGGTTGSCASPAPNSFIDLLSDFTEETSLTNDCQQTQLNRFTLPKESTMADPLTSSLKKTSSVNITGSNDDDFTKSEELFEKDQIKDMEVFDQINKDVFRTRAEVPLFSSPLQELGQDRSFLHLTNSYHAPQRTIDIISPKVHVDILGRILFIYSKLHPSLKYVQGMNELLAPIFFVVFSDPLIENVEQAEVDAFFCFSALFQMNGQFELFCRVFDKDRLGVLGRVGYLSRLLQFQDPPVAMHFHHLNLDIQFFALRWILLLCTQEFSLSDTMRLWDSLIADGYDIQSNDSLLLYFICLAIIEQLRDDLLSSDFSSCMRLLQNLPSVNPEELISRAVALRQSFESAKSSGFVPQLISPLADSITSSQSRVFPLTPPPLSASSNRDALVGKVRRAYHDFISSNEAREVKEIAVNIGTVGADYAKSAAKSVGNWLNTSQLSFGGSSSSAHHSLSQSASQDIPVEYPVGSYATHHRSISHRDTIPTNQYQPVATPLVSNQYFNESSVHETNHPFSSLQTSSLLLPCSSSSRQSKMSQSTSGQKVSQSTYGQRMSQSTSGEKMSQSTYGQRMSQSTSGQGISQSTSEQMIESLKPPPPPPPSFRPTKPSLWDRTVDPPVDLLSFQFDHHIPNTSFTQQQLSTSIQDDETRSDKLTDDTKKRRHFCSSRNSLL